MNILKRVLKLVKGVFKYALYAVLLLVFTLGLWILYANHLKNGFSDGYTESSVESNAMHENYGYYQSLLDTVSEKYDKAGIQATIIFENGEQWTGSSGYANHSKKIPVTNQSVFNIGSITKLYTSTLTMSLVEHKKMALDDSLSKWFNTANPAWADIKIDQLLNHRSGIPDYMEAIILKLFMFPNRNWDQDDLIRSVSEEPLFESNKFNYSSTNYLLLGKIIEKIDGTSYRDVLLKQIIAPLHLKKTFYEDSNISILPVVHSYENNLPGLGRVNVTGFRNSFLTSGNVAGAILSNSEDVALFTKALFSNQIVSKPQLNMMTDFNSVNDLNIPKNTGYGLGVSRWDIGNQELWGHSGFIPGFKSITMYSPKHQYVITVLANQSNVNTRKVLEELQNVLLKKLDKESEPINNVTINNED